MQKLSDCFAFKRGERTAVVGSGGKTTLLWLLAQTHRDKKVLVTTTTQMSPPQSERIDRVLDGEELAGEEAITGVTFAADTNAAGKKVSPGLDQLERAAPRYDLVLYEADGSRNLPLKGWAEYEPVVPPFTSCTIGVIPLWPLGRRADESIIHRFPLFCRLTGISPGETITARHLVKVICGGSGADKGLFEKALGQKTLFFSQIESPDDWQNVQTVMSLLPKNGGEQTMRIIAGSAKQNVGRVLPVD
ncbi:putative selenium-dependent hydroxylase accessory protein YqeC [Ruminococcaceae bacterium OttesenSCG-928-I18]|nr:putative selenium-dependent hydroxylase accessory protein YqeC [Ruminococcaceae bacterium OttesenSCG-928-I18]